MRMQFESIDDYISSFPEPVQILLQKMRRAIHEAAPDATEAISYGIPTLKLRGKNLVHFAAFRDHMSFFPTASGIEAFESELSDYGTSRGTVRFPLDEPIPYDLVRRIVAFRVREVSEGRR